MSSYPVPRSLPPTRRSLPTTRLVPLGTKSKPTHAGELRHYGVLRSSTKPHSQTFVMATNAHATPTTTHWRMRLSSHSFILETLLSNVAGLKESLVSRPSLGRRNREKWC